MVVLVVEVDPEEVGQPSSTLRMRQEHVRERTLVRRGPTWAVGSEGAFATHRGGDAFVARLDDQPCFGEDLDLCALIITPGPGTGGNFQAWQHVRASAVFSPFQGGRPSISPDDSLSPPESLDSYAFKKSAL